MAWHGEMRGLNETVIPAGHPGFRLFCQGKSSSTTEKCLELHLEGFIWLLRKVLSSIGTGCPGLWSCHHSCRDLEKKE